MEAKWLEDFLSVARTGSFSLSAAERHITQSAFSRRIKSLEQWVGVALIDRSSYPTRLTAAGPWPCRRCTSWTSSTSPRCAASKPPSRGCEQLAPAS